MHLFYLQWPLPLRELKSRLEENTGLCFNSMLANLYRDGHDSVAWHSDDEPELGPNPTIVSLSFGDVRNFEMRQKLAKVYTKLVRKLSKHIHVPQFSL